MFKFEELKVYQDSVELSNEIYSFTKLWPKDEMFGLTNQIRRAAVSIALNIAEGSSRSKKDFVHFLNISRGSCFECVAILGIANKQGYIDNKMFNRLYEKFELLSKMINALKNSINL